MGFSRLRVILLSSAVLSPLAFCLPTAFGQQVVQRGAMGVPSEVMDETGQWTVPILMSSDHDVELYIPDVSSPAWLQKNYAAFQDKHQYELSMFTFYKTTKACRASQVAWGFGDGASLDACIDIGYRVREATIDVHLKTVTLIMAAMVGQDGEVLPDSIQRQPMTRNWTDLDANAQAALEKSAELIRTQMKHYDQRLQGNR